MRINTIKYYEMYLSVEEFELLYSIASSVPFGYQYTEDVEIKVTIEDDYMLEEIKDKLEHAAYVAEYEECYRHKADKIKELMNGIYLELM